jgi:hypothetical protein
MRRALKGRPSRQRGEEARSLCSSARRFDFSLLEARVHVGSVLGVRLATRPNLAKLVGLAPPHHLGDVRSAYIRVRGLASSEAPISLLDRVALVVRPRVVLGLVPVFLNQDASVDDDTHYERLSL